MLTNDKITFHDMERRYGPALAYQVLTDIEKASGIRSSDMIELDPETRLANALQTQDASRRPLRLAA